MNKVVLIISVIAFGAMFSGCTSKSKAPDDTDTEVIIESPSDETEFEEGQFRPSSASPEGDQDTTRRRDLD